MRRTPLLQRHRLQAVVHVVLKDLPANKSSRRLRLLEQLVDNRLQRLRIRSQILQQPVVERRPQPHLIGLFQRNLDCENPARTSRNSDVSRRRPLRLSRKLRNGSTRAARRGATQAPRQLLSALSVQLQRVKTLPSSVQSSRAAARRLDRPRGFLWRPSTLHRLVRRLQRPLNRTRNRKSRRGLKTRQNDAFSRLLEVLLFRGAAQTSRPWWTRCISISHPPTPPQCQLAGSEYDLSSSLLKTSSSAGFEPRSDPWSFDSQPQRHSWTL